MQDNAAHMRIIDRCIKRRNSRRPARVVDLIRVPDVAWADAVVRRMKAAGYDPTPRRPDEPITPKPKRGVSLSITEFLVVAADELATAQGITPEQFMADILQEGLFEAFLEMQAQRRFQLKETRRDLDDEIPF